MNFNEAFKIWYEAESAQDIGTEVMVSIKNEYIGRPVFPVDVKDPLLNPISAYHNISRVLWNLTAYYADLHRHANDPTVANIRSLYNGTSGLKTQKELMELVHPESKIYGIKFIRWMAHRIKNHLHGRDLFYDEDKDPQPAPEKPEECEDHHNGWWCTKDKGHTDDHEATGPDGDIYATWPNVPKTPVEPEECWAMHNDWMCTKDKGHDGDHEAGDGDPNGQIFCIWPNVPKAPAPFDNILIVHEGTVPWYNRIGIPMKIWKDVEMQQRHLNGEKIRITIERI